jgi:cytochrome c-type biogenesis protein
MKVYGAYSDYFSKHGDPTLIMIDVNWNVVKHAGFMGHEDISKNITKALEGEQDIDPIESSLGLAGMFALGIATSLAPCSIALLATMMMFLISRRDATLAGAAPGSKDKPKKGKGKDGPGKGEVGLRGRSSLMDGLVIGLFFTLGTVAVFILLGLFVGYVSVFVSLSPVFFVITGIILILLGFNSIFNLVEKITGFVQERFSKAGIKEALPAWARFITRLWGHSSELGAFMLGVMFSLAWAPCAVSLVLPVIVVLLAAKVDLLAGCALLFFFGLGHGVAIIPIAVVSETSKAAITKR